MEWQLGQPELWARALSFLGHASTAGPRAGQPQPLDKVFVAPQTCLVLVYPPLLGASAAGAAVGLHAAVSPLCFECSTRPPVCGVAPVRPRRPDLLAADTWTPPSSCSIMTFTARVAVWQDGTSIKAAALNETLGRSPTTDTSCVTVETPQPSAMFRYVARTCVSTVALTSEWALGSLLQLPSPGFGLHPRRSCASCGCRGRRRGVGAG